MLVHDAAMIGGITFNETCGDDFWIAERQELRDPSKDYREVNLSRVYYSSRQFIHGFQRCSSHWCPNPPRPPMMWSLMEFLDRIDIHGDSWCLIEMGDCSGFRVVHGREVFIHAVLEGQVRLTGNTGEPVDLFPNDVAVLISGDTHKLRAGPGHTAEIIEELCIGRDADKPSIVKVGVGASACRLLSGRLQVHWPGGYQPVRLPNPLRVCASELGFDLARLGDAIERGGSFALLDRAAALLFVEGLRSQPYFRAQFRWNLQDPVARAMLLIERHPFSAWSVRSLAERVGMGRSNFAARFTSQVGKTPIDALTEVRMKYAQQFLRNTDLKIPEIGELIGYRSESAFVRRFTKHFKITPAGLRQHEAVRVQ